MRLVRIPPAFRGRSGCAMPPARRARARAPRAAASAAAPRRGVPPAPPPRTAGLSRPLRVRNAAGTESTVTVAKADYSLDPISDRNGTRIIDDGGRRVGYVNLRTFSVQSADADLRQAFRNFRTQGV